MHRDNVGLREAMATATPLIYFYGLVPGSYEAAYPAFIVGEEPSESCFVVAVNDARQLMRHISAPHVAESLDASIRAYATTVVQRRLHQDGFRARVLQAYDSMCAVCRLRHRNLLDAAHILPDSHPLGDPWVSNGLALCKLHHAAFDQNILGIRPNLIVEIREDVLREKDGPMLMHGLQEMHGKPLGKVPMRAAKRPKEEFLAERYAIFRKAS